MTQTPGVNRRAFLAGGGAGLAALTAIARPVAAAEPSALEQTNMRIVKDFCAAWPSHDLARILSFFADNGAYRMTETMEPVTAMSGADDGR